MPIIVLHSTIIAIALMVFTLTVGIINFIVLRVSLDPYAHRDTLARRYFMTYTIVVTVLIVTLLWSVLGVRHG